jgi:predicted Zn-dependent protease
VTHATHRHTIQELRGVRRSSAVLSTFQVLTLPFGVFGLAATALGTVGHVAAVQGYSRGKESEADREGLALAVAAGYSPQEAPKLFEHLRRDLEARKIDEPFFFGTHPRLIDRVNSYRRLIEDRYASTTGEIGEERYQRTMTTLFLDNAKTDLAIGRFALAETSLERVLRQGTEHSEALYLLGEICRQRNTGNDAACSEARYRDSVAADPHYPDAHKALGLLLLKRGDRQGAKQELELYLQYAPQAADRKHVEEELRRL